MSFTDQTTGVPRQTNFFFAVGVFLLVLIFGALLFENESLRGTNKTLYEDVSTLKDEISRLKVEVETLIENAEEETRKEIETRLAVESQKISALREELSEESAKRVALEEALRRDTGLSSARLSQLENNLGSQYNLVSIIGEWRKRTASVSCLFSNGTKSGSGVLVNLGGESPFGVVTNKHVLENQFGGVARTCTVRFPDVTGSFSGNAQDGEIEVSTVGQDIGRIVLKNPSAELASIAVGPSRFCVSRPATGDEIIILGYPVIGSDTDITATEGIISGFDDPYFITSAKIEQGNSGGAAVLLKDNCLLGIPTFVQLGTLEALGRILNINALF